MKVLINFDGDYHLVKFDSESQTYDNMDLYHQVNKGRYPDECYDIDYVMETSTIVCFFNDGAEKL